ncbi:MAG TPA: caspase family protein [Sphingobacteriaceae bacterium]
MLRIVLFFTFLVFTEASFSRNLINVAADFDEAVSLAKQADELLKTGDVPRATELINQSISKYPVAEVFDYAKSLARLSDLTGANMIMEKVIERVRSFPTNTLMAKSPIPGVQTSAETEKSRVLWGFAFRSYQVNRAFGNRDQIIRSMKLMEEPVIIEKKAKNKYTFDVEAHMQRVFRYMRFMFEGDLVEAERLLNAIPTGVAMSNEIRQLSQVSLDVLANNFDKAFSTARDLQTKKGYEDSANYIYFYIYAMKGDQKAMEYFPKLLPTLQEQNRTYYLLALLDLAKKDYASALKNLKLSTSLRETNILMSDQLTENWDLYKAFGDAYTGLKEYSKARENYAISLLYYQNYKPTQDALAALSRLQDAEIGADKTAPVITITSPETRRGLKVTRSESEQTIRGIAADPAGIQSVTINGQAAYVQDAGDFWASVTLKTGSNIIKVVATDKAGNTGTHQFTIEKTSIQPNPASDIIAVKESEGRNYCLLIAAQNYSDSAIPSLENPIADAIKLKIVLKNQYAFEDADIITLFNPQATDIKRKLMELSNLIRPEDNLVIFYAGHGIWVDKEKKGYWLMTDAKYNDRSTWLPNKDVLDLIAKLPARHTLLITDACFSGSVFRTRGLGAGAPVALREMDEKISRVAITSGNDTEVPDESVFMKYLVKALSENNERYLTAQKMFVTKIIEAVMTETKTEPRYGTLESAGHIGGDFIFTKR